MTDIQQLLRQLNPQASLVERHVWLISLTDWIRGDAISAQDAVSRIETLLDLLQADPELTFRFRQWWLCLDQDIDASTLLADFGFATRSAFFGELVDRLRLRLLPMTPETTDSAELFSLVMHHKRDTQWLGLLEPHAIERLASLLSLSANQSPMTRWQQELLQALQYCGSQIRAAGLSAELRRRMDAQARHQEPFQGLAAEVESFCLVYARSEPNDAAMQEAVLALKTRLDACRSAAQTVYSHLEDHGVSVDLVFILRQTRLRLLRMRELMDCLVSATPHAASVYLMMQLVDRGQERRSISALISSSTSLLAAKVAERQAETGEHYITRDAHEYRTMLRQAAGGGAATALTTWAKFALASLGFVTFWGGVATGLMYAASFVLIQLLHWTLATKQPASTAPAIAAKLKDIKSDEALESFTDEISHLVRSQVAAVLGNVGLVMPCVLLISVVLYAAGGQPMINVQEAREVLGKLNLLNPSTLLFAAFTGVLLFISSLIAGWAENWFVLYRLHSAIRYNPRISNSVGAPRAARWASFLRRNISGFAGNISLGLMLGVVPVLMGFLGLGLDVRHVTLSMGQLSAAFGTLILVEGNGILREPDLWWCLLALPLIAVANLSVSFFLAFQLASRANVVTAQDQQRIRQSLGRRLRKRLGSFFLPVA